jgi:uncharacterized peroxidase-related enzyme
MAWMPWIKTEHDDTRDENIRNLYDRTRNRLTGQPPDTVKLASTTPEVAGLLFDLQRAVYQSATGLSVREKEIAALVVSAYNGCTHWTASHLAALGRAAKDEKLAEQVRNDYTKAELPVRERKIADFALKVTRAADTCTQEDLQALRDAGLSDKDILALAEIIGYYNMTNRLFESLSTIEP